MNVSFEVPVQPTGKGRHRSAIVGGKIHTYTPQSTANYENLVKVMYLHKARQTRLTGQIRAYITAYYPIPKSWSKKRKEAAIMGNERPQNKPDCDNIAKIILDSLNGVAYDDDKQVVFLTVEKYYSLYPRVVVSLSNEEKE